MASLRRKLLVGAEEILVDTSPAGQASSRGQPARARQPAKCHADMHTLVQRVARQGSGKKRLHGAMCMRRLGAWRRRCDEGTRRGGGPKNHESGEGGLRSSTCRGVVSVTSHMCGLCVHERGGSISQEIRFFASRPLYNTHATRPNVARLDIGSPRALHRCNRREAGPLEGLGRRADGH